MISVLELRSVRGTGGGPDKTILEGAAAHDRSRFAVTVCYVRDERDGAFTIDLRARNLGVDYVELRERHSFDHRIWHQLLSLVRARGTQIVHGHDYKTNLLAYLVARRTSAVPLATCHNWSGQTPRERYIYYPAERALLTRFPRVIAVSSTVRNRLIESGLAPARTALLLNGVDTTTFRRDAARRERVRQQLGVADDVMVIGAVGRLEREKRFDLLLRAFAQVHRDWRATLLVVAGGGGLRTELEATAGQLGIAACCRFLGHRTDIADLQDAFDMFVQSSEREGAPNAVLEAMAMETPVVATNVGGTREIAFPGLHGLLVPSHDIEALAVGMRRVLADPAAAWRRAVAAREWVERELSFAGRIGRLERIYEDLIVSHGRVEFAVGEDRSAGVSGA